MVKRISFRYFNSWVLKLDFLTRLKDSFRAFYHAYFNVFSLVLVGLSGNACKNVSMCQFSNGGFISVEGKSIKYLLNTVFVTHSSENIVAPIECLVFFYLFYFGTTHYSKAFKTQKYKKKTIHTR